MQLSQDLTDKYSEKKNAVLSIYDLSHSNANANAMPCQVMWMSVFISCSPFRSLALHLWLSISVVCIVFVIEIYSLLQIYASSVCMITVGTLHRRICTVPLKSQFDFFFFPFLFCGKKWRRRQEREISCNILSHSGRVAFLCLFCFERPAFYYFIHSRRWRRWWWCTFEYFFFSYCCTIYSRRFCLYFRFDSLVFVSSRSILSLAAVSFTSVVNADVCVHHTLHWEIEENGKSYNKHLRWFLLFWRRQQHNSNCAGDGGICLYRL